MTTNSTNTHENVPFHESFSGCGSVSKLPLLLLNENVPFHESFSGCGSVSKLPLLLLIENVQIGKIRVICVL